MSSFAAGKPSQGSSPNSVSPYSTLVVQVVSTFQSVFDESLPHIDASSLTGRSLSLWPEMYHSRMINALCEVPSNIFKRFLDPNKDGPLQLKLFTRMPSQSRMSIMYNFSRDYILREHYRDPRNEVRIGKLLEDLDVLAGTIDMKHCSDDDSTTRPLLLVTASVDKMVLKRPLRVDTDVRIAGAVTWVGHSYIEMTLNHQIHWL